MVWSTPTGRQRIEIRDQHRLASRPHLLHRHAGGLRRSSLASRSVQAGATELPRQRIYASRRDDPSIDMKTAVRDQVNRMDAVTYFTLLAQLMKANPPSAA